MSNTVEIQSNTVEIQSNTVSTGELHAPTSQLVTHRRVKSRTYHDLSTCKLKFTPFPPWILTTCSTTASNLSIWDLSSFLSILINVTVSFLSAPSKHPNGVLARRINWEDPLLSASEQFNTSSTNFELTLYATRLFPYQRDHI